MPAVSVLLPVYNAEKYIAFALDSILEQTFSDFELLVLDDGSSDSSADIVRTRAAKDARVKLHCGPHQGLTWWLNAGLEFAKGELIARMDADDIAHPDRIAIQVRYLAAHPECCLLGSEALMIDPDGCPISAWRVPSEHRDIDSQHMSGRPGAIIHPSIMARRLSLIQVGGYRKKYELAEDYDLFLRMAEVGTLSNLNRPLLKYRLHEKSVTISRAAEQHRVTSEVLIDAWERRGKSGPVPAPDCGKTSPSKEELQWFWANASFGERHFATSRKYAFRLLRNRPGSVHRWILFIAAGFGPAAHALRRLIPYRQRSYNAS